MEYKEYVCRGVLPTIKKKLERLIEGKDRNTKKQGITPVIFPLEKSIIHGCQVVSTAESIMAIFLPYLQSCQSKLEDF